MSVKLSIVVPVYNAEKTLKRCIDSILSQSFTDFELILVDDGSTDNSPKICDEYKEKSDKILLIHQENQGSVSARQNGFTAASGDYVLSIDSDDWIDSNALELMMDKLGDADVLAVGFISETDDGQIFEENSLPSGVYTPKELEDKLLYNGDFYNSGIIPSLWSKIFRRVDFLKVFNDVPKNVRMGEDLIVSFPIILQSKKIVVCNEIKAYHYVRGTQTLSTAYDPKYFESLESLYNWLNFAFKGTKTHDDLGYYIIFLLTIGASKQLSIRNKQLLRKIKDFTEEISKPWVVDSISNIEEEKVPNYIWKLKEYICSGKFKRIIFLYYFHLVLRKLHIN